VLQGGTFAVSVQELANNVDSYKYSTYMSKDRYGLLRMGPAWDYDLAFGNVATWLDLQASGHTQFKYEENAKLKIPDVSAWYARLMADPAFVEKVRTRWQVQ